MVQVHIGFHNQLEGTEVDVKGLVINAVGLINILYQLGDREGGAVGLNHSEGTTLKMFMIWPWSVYSSQIF